MLKFLSPSTQRNRLRLLGYSARSRTSSLRQCLRIREATTCLPLLHATPPLKQATTQPTSKRFVSQSGVITELKISASKTFTVDLSNNLSCKFRTYDSVTIGSWCVRSEVLFLRSHRFVASHTLQKKCASCSRPKVIETQLFRCKICTGLTIKKACQILITI